MTTASGGKWRLGNQPALDGLRAVAVLAVCVFHAGRAPGGWLGVEAFFVLSGFLITTLLLSERATQGRVDIGRFYIRRAARLLPALFIVLVFSIVAAIATDRTVEGTVRGEIWSALYVMNWAEIPGVDHGPLEHIWSLSIEEQFYCLWPLALLLAARSGRSAVMRTAIAGAAVSMLLRPMIVMTDHQWWERVYYGTDTRAAGLLAGCALGAWLADRGGAVPPAVRRGFVIWPLIVALGLSMLLLPHKAAWSYTIGLTLFDLGVAVLILALIDARSAPARILSSAPAAYIGRLSYSLYLWQLPVLWTIAFTLQGPLRVPAQVLAPFACAALTYHLVENPIRLAAKRRRPMPATTEQQSAIAP